MRALMMLSVLSGAVTPMVAGAQAHCFTTPPEQESREAKFIFAGRVQVIEEVRSYVARPLDSAQIRLNAQAVTYTGAAVASSVDTFIVSRTAIVEVQSVWKGQVPSKVRVSLSDEPAWSPSRFDGLFQLDSSVLLFATSAKRGDYLLSVCSASRPLTAASQWLQVLGEPQWRAPS